MRRRLLGIVTVVLLTISSAGASRARAGADVALDALTAAATARGVSLGSPDIPAADPATSVAAFAAASGSDPLAAVALVESLSPSYARGVGMLAAAMTRAAELRHAAFARVGAAEFERAVALSARAAAGSLDLDGARDLAAVVAAIEPAPMLAGAALMARAVEQATPLFDAAEAPAAASCTPNGLICIGSDGADTWSQHVQLLVDPAGDDTYLNNAGGVFSSQVSAASGGCALGGGTTGASRPNLDCTPLPSSVCTYDTANRAAGVNTLPRVGLPGHDDPGGRDGGRGTDGSCGSTARRQRLVNDTQGIGSDPDSRVVALSLDLDGSDTYSAEWSHTDYLFGLIDFCHPGDETKRNTNNDFVQGSALGGIGILWDEGSGDDRYRGRLNVQGSGHVGGVGMVVSGGEGDDLFWADRLSQGNGIAGGVGVLASAKRGHQTFLLDAPLVYRNEFGPGGRECAQEGRAGQGEGGFAGVGVLWSDHEGTATYRAVTHRTKVAAPYDPILDGSGRPILVAGTDAQGSGESFPIADTPGGLVLGVGVLVDRTDGDARVCPPDATGAPSAGMTTGSTQGSGIAVTGFGAVAPCGKFNLPPELDPLTDLSDAMRHLAAGAAGIRVVT